MRFSNNFNAYHFNLLLAAKTTDDIAEGSNLYFTDARALSIVGATADLIKAANIDWGLASGQVNLDSVPDGNTYQRVAAACAYRQE